ncbi:MAG TPA: hypothetical protein VID48_16540 [Solirubrobacteraceae bacterium]
MSAFPQSSRNSLSFRLALAVLLATVVPALCGSTASAALISTGACDGSTLSQPFARWGDENTYKMVTGGDFEGSLSGWTLSQGAQRVSGSEPYGAAGSVGGYSLKLTAGASATSPFTCANASDPIFRFFAKNGGLLSTVSVQVIYKTALGQLVLPLGVAALSNTWHPTLPLLTGSAVGGLLSGGTTQIALRFTALTGSSQIDDVFIDPRMN